MPTFITQQVPHENERPLVELLACQSYVVDLEVTGGKIGKIAVVECDEEDIITTVYKCDPPENFDGQLTDEQINELCVPENQMKIVFDGDIVPLKTRIDGYYLVATFITHKTMDDNITPDKSI